jgi:site-specific DNA-methyltransferase (adenine-specific)
MIVITVARKPLSEASVAENVLKHGTGALNIDATRIGMLDATSRTHQSEFQANGRWPTNLILEHQEACHQTETTPACAPDCPVAALDIQVGKLHHQDPATRQGRPGKHGTGGGTTYLAQKETGAHYADQGSASRFFKQVKPGSRRG